MTGLSTLGKANSTVGTGTGVPEVLKGRIYLTKYATGVFFTMLVMAAGAAKLFRLS